MKKGIATQTILLFLVGIIVVGILVYLVYRTVASPPLSATECKARLISYCITCKNAGWMPGIHYPLEECEKVLADAYGIILAGKSKCDGIKLECKMVGVE